MTVRHTSTVHCDYGGCASWADQPGTRLPPAWARRVISHKVLHFCPTHAPEIAGIKQLDLYT